MRFRLRGVGSVDGGPELSEPESATARKTAYVQPAAKAKIDARSQFLVTTEVAERLRMSPRKVHELARTRRIPHRKFPYCRPLLYIPAELDAWAEGASLEVTELEGGGRIVRPNSQDAAHVSRRP
jgi:Helix-turn-helix domain